MKSPAIVLTTDETMMSRYRGGIFVGFATCIPQGVIPDWIFFHAVAPPVPRKNGRAIFADQGTRMIEAALLESGFGEDEVAVVHPRDLPKMVGENTGIVSVSGHDLLGINPPTSTFADLLRTGPPYNRVMFLELMRNPVLRNVTTVVGGKSAWQVAEEGVMDRLGIDHVHLGEGEVSVPKAFSAILAGEEVPRVIHGEEVPLEKIPVLKGATIHGLAEISRGCNRGCKFCTPGMQKIRHKPIDQIAADVRLNAAGGNSCAILHAEDVLAYGSKKIEPEPEKVAALFTRVAGIEGVKGIGLSHLALATAYHNPALIETIADIIYTLPNQNFIGVQTGIETGSPRIMEMYMKSKCAPSSPGDWPDIVKSSLGLLNDHDIIPACTLIAGLPGEEEEDVILTIEMMEDIRDTRSLVVPLNFVSMDPAALSDKDSFTAEKMTPSHWELLGVCIDHDMRMVRRMNRYIVEGNMVLTAIARLAMRYMVRGAEKYSREMKQGQPPAGWDITARNYLVPEF
ncbi:radical SAM superfamily enzyme YgiQ (UPF0313 family) [Methanolinea mesophila]|uniref:B12-binding domain-containing radical SAM protein n=1 Tax=Methanolinea mesophila TaxID=547055 RepID=UPI001AEB62C4|nr:radical SAM superfamily enzyme YgiQ (UPF0313 family) [Methanolinea mesophila]